jgi:signal transduction histidine kinase
MVSNHIVMPIWLSLRSEGASMSGDVRKVVLQARRFSIAAILALGYTYFRYTGGSEALAAIGLISFAGVAQVLPSLIGGIFWRGANLKGAAAGLVAGFAIWAYTLFLPSFEGSWIMPEALLAEGPFGIAALRPQALFGIEGADPLVHAMVWSLGLNTALFLAISLLSFPTPLERLQGAQFVNVFQHSAGPGGWVGGSAAAEDLLVMAQRIIGAREAQALFQQAARAQGKAGNLPDPTPDFIDMLERELSGSVGAATAHAMIGQITGGAAVSVEDLLAVADETAEIMEYSSRLEAKSQELAETAAQLREANDKLTEISIQKDAFLSQISHELRTPMSSIRAFSEILRDTGELAPDQLRRYASIIHDESLRLTRLLDDLLDLSVLENGQVALHVEDGNLSGLLDRAVSATSSMQAGRDVTIQREPSAENVALRTDCDRLSQVFINLIANARKYCDAETPQLRISVATTRDRIQIDFVDNGTGIPEKQQSIIFEKFARLSDQAAAGSAGLGLAISREIMRNLGGSIAYLPGRGGAAFRVSLPRGPGVTAS